MKRYLRIAVSAFFGLLTVALIVLWVRSYQWTDTLYTMRADQVVSAISSDDGMLGVYRTMISFPMPFGIHSCPDSVFRGYYWEVMAPKHCLTFPIWAAALVSASFATVPWLQYVGRLRRFRLSTMFIVTALLALVLGLICCSIR